MEDAHRLTGTHIVDKYGNLLHSKRLKNIIKSFFLVLAWICLVSLFLPSTFFEFMQQYLYINASLMNQIFVTVHSLIIPTQCFYRFSEILIGPLAKLNCFYTSMKTHAQEYLIYALILQW